MFWKSPEMVHTGGSCLPPHHQSLIRNGNGSLRMWNKDYGLESPEQLVLPEPAIWTTGVGVILYSVMSNMLGEIRVQPACLFSNEAAGSVLTVVIATSDSQCTGLEMTRSYFCLRPLTHTFVSRVFIDAGQTSISAQIDPVTSTFSVFTCWAFCYQGNHSFYSKGYTLYGMCSCGFTCSGCKSRKDYII